MSAFAAMRIHPRPRSAALLAAALSVSAAHAAQVDIAGPLGSVAFGNSVTVLPNGNVVVTDPQGPVSNVGAVYLYAPNGTLISTLTGSSQDDNVGSGGVFVVGGGNFVVSSPYWNNGAATSAGAVTWVDGSAGLSALVSSDNSLVGTTSGDQVGLGGLAVLANGNYVVASQAWNGNAGAATWGSGASGIKGAVSADNSLVGSLAGDRVGYYSALPLSNGNYVVFSYYWNGGLGAATWGSGATGISGAISAGNSQIGATSGDQVGYYGGVALGNGNYVVASPSWNGTIGAATWGDGTGATTGVVSAQNSIVGTAAGDMVGSRVVALDNGNYVVAETGWNSGRGAATWASGASATSLTVAPANSLVGTSAGDNVGYSVTALSNGNYVVGSENWNGARGAATWASGSAMLSAIVSGANSLVGSAPGDAVGYAVTALSNGNYVVGSPNWNGNLGAATWCSGTAATSAAISSGNSLVGVGTADYVGTSITALTNGNYVVFSANGSLGAATWGNGAAGIAGTISAANSLVGSVSGDMVGGYGDSVVALSNGNYVVLSAPWRNYGAATWGNGALGTTGTVSAANSLVGTSSGDHVGNAAVAFGDGNYLIESSNWGFYAGAFTLASDAFRLTGEVAPWNSVIGTNGAGGPYMVYAYDAARHRLVVGRPYDNVVSLFTMDQVFAFNFE